MISFGLIRKRDITHWLCAYSKWGLGMSEPSLVQERMSISEYVSHIFRIDKIFNRINRCSPQILLYDNLSAHTMSALIWIVSLYLLNICVTNLRAKINSDFSLERWHRWIEVQTIKQIIYFYMSIGYVICIYQLSSTNNQFKYADATWRFKSWPSWRKYLSGKKFQSKRNSKLKHKKILPQNIVFGR